QAVGQGSGGVVIDGSGNQIFDPNVVYNSMAKFLGQAYVWGGASPTGFDCSGLMQWNFRQTVGINLPRTAEEQYHATARVSKEQLKAGDLIFFTGTYVGKTVTHVGMYIGNGKMINSNNSGVKIDDVFSPYWGKYYYGAGRITHK
ncbi:C40 family peptidase, partial [Bacillus thuringiensis]|nr:C40 family peptidase [Bacillus thuringiensis]